LPTSASAGRILPALPGTRPIATKFHFASTENARDSSRAFRFLQG
jgi:hypothetical protein